MSGGSPRKVSPKKPGGATPITVTGQALMMTALPINEGSRLKFCCQIR